jgi:hypothetical protein
LLFENIHFGKLQLATGYLIGLNPASKRALLEGRAKINNPTKRQKKRISKRIKAVPDISEKPIARIFWIEKDDANMQQSQ